MESDIRGHSYSVHTCGTPHPDSDLMLHQPLFQYNDAIAQPLPIHLHPDDAALATIRILDHNDVAARVPHRPLHLPGPVESLRQDGLASHISLLGEKV